MFDVEEWLLGSSVHWARKLRPGGFVAEIWRHVRVRPRHPPMWKSWAGLNSITHHPPVHTKTGARDVWQNQNNTWNARHLKPTVLGLALWHIMSSYHLSCPYPMCVQVQGPSALLSLQLSANMPGSSTRAPATYTADLDLVPDSLPDESTGGWKIYLF